MHGTEDNGTFVNYASFQNKNKGMPERLFFCNKPIVKAIGARTSNVTLDVWWVIGTNKVGVAVSVIGACKSDCDSNVIVIQTWLWF